MPRGLMVGVRICASQDLGVRFISSLVYLSNVDRAYVREHGLDNREGNRGGGVVIEKMNKVLPREVHSLARRPDQTG